MATSGKGGFRNNGQPRVQLRPGLTRVAQLKAALREIRDLDTGNLTRDERIRQICWQAIEGTYVPENFRPPTPAQLEARAGIIPHDPQDDEPEGDYQEMCPYCLSTPPDHEDDCERPKRRRKS